VNFELGPAAVARMASLPVSLLSELAVPDLAGHEAAAREGRMTWAAFEAAHEAALETGRARLWALTAEDPAFLLALSFAHPRLPSRIARQAGGAPRTPKRRRLERTLLRYLLRAAGRCQPFGLWSGVALTTWGPETRITRCPAALRIEPDLGPFFEMVAVLSRRPRYRTQGAWRLNPSMGRRPDGRWTFRAPTSAGPDPREIPASPTADALLEALAASDPGGFDLLGGRLAGICGGEEAARGLLESCAEGGVLVGGLQPPWRFHTAWEALERIEDDLLPPERAAWKAARMELHGRCREMEQKGLSLEARDVLQGSERAEEMIRRLASAVDIEAPELPEAPLRCDLRAGVSIRLGPEIRSRIQATLDSYSRFQGEYGFGAAIRRAVLRHYLPAGIAARTLEDLPEPSGAAREATTWQGLGEAIGADAEYNGLVGRWELLLSGSPEGVVAGGSEVPVGPPLGWLRIGLPSGPGGAGRFVVHGVFDDLWGPLARHTPFWRVTRESDDLQSWIRTSLEGAARAGGIGLAELVAPCGTALNALARPPTGWPAASPWTSLPGGPDLRGARLVLENGSVAPYVELRAPGGRIAVVNAGSANVQSRDPLVQLLLTTSLGATPAVSLHAGSMLFRHELAGEVSSPEVVLETGGLVRTGRTVLTGSAADRLLSGSPARRYAEWCRLARRHDWPPIVVLRRGDGFSLPLHRSSPLALDALLEGAHAGPLVIERWPAEDWLGDGSHRTVAELAIPFLRTRHIWSGPAGASGVGGNASGRELP
jgi:Lantibiotic dehydratase, N terminus